MVDLSTSELLYFECLEYLDKIDCTDLETLQSDFKASLCVFGMLLDDFETLLAVFEM